MDRPESFTDVMLKGAFAFMCHEHIFKAVDGQTQMTDKFEFRSPLGPLGRLVDWLFLKHYMTRFLEIRNHEIKRVAEGNDWSALLQEA
jgi:ligand-binding SRPBCC domain-containing protein